MKRNSWVLALIACVIGSGWAQPYPSAFREDDVDAGASRFVTSSGSEPLEDDQIRELLWVETTKGVARKRSDAKSQAGAYLLAFKRPVEIGTVLGGSGDVRILKPEGSWPPDPSRSTDWVGMEGAQSQNLPGFMALQPGVRTRAILMTPRKVWNAPQLLGLLGARLFNRTPWAVVNADAEYTTEPQLSAPRTYAAQDLATGRGEWINTGKDGKGLIPRPPISDVAPSWVVLSWAEKQRVDGLLLGDNFERFEVQSYEGPDGINAVAATEQEWKTVKPLSDVKQSVGSHPLRWMRFGGLHTRAIRLLIKKTSDGAVAKLSCLQAFSDLGEKAIPEMVARVVDEAPVRVPYKLDEAGKVTIVVESADGTRVRNIAANIERSAGENTFAWDLKDEAGDYVPVGTYRWRAITHPPLELRYAMTAYPNVNTYFPDQPAWQTGANGPGGWLADHTPPRAACVAGDRVFLGAPVAESGVSLIECDLEGRKLWGHPSFAAFTGVGMLASDGKTVFNTMTARNFAKTGIDKTSEAIWAVDLETRAVRTLPILQPSAERSRGIQGFAARDNKVYVAVHARQNWLNNAVGAADVDLGNSLPAYAVARRPAAGEVVPDPRNDFLRLLRLKDTPPGQNLIFLETTKGAEREQHMVVAFNRAVAVGSLVFAAPPKEDKMQFRISVLKGSAPYPPRAREKDDWVMVPYEDRSGWAVVPLPQGTSTRAVRFTFLRGGADSVDELLADVEEKKAGVTLDSVLGGPSKKGAPAKLGGSEGEQWKRQIEGMKILARRFENVTSSATVRVNSGKVASDGVWDAQRSEPLSAAEPAVYALEWKQAQTLRGLAIKEIDGALTEIDVFTGNGPVPPDIASEEGWENVASYQQPLREYYQPDVMHNPQARYLDGYVDFGREVSTRAVRLRVVKQWETKAHRPTGVRVDQGGQVLDLKRCRIYGVAALKYLGGESAINPLASERVEVIDGSSGQTLKEVHLPRPGEPSGKDAPGNTLAFDAQGRLVAISDRKLVRVDLEGGAHVTLASDLIRPTALACDAGGNHLVYDAAPERRNIRVYDAQGGLVREIGSAGGHQVGAWDPTRLDSVSAIAVDPKGQVWVVESTYWPKRVSLWSAQGTFLKEFLGPTQYGGAGRIDPGDKRRMFYGPLEFELDWDTGKTRLKNLTSMDGAETGDIPRRVNGRLYLVNTRTQENPQHGLVYLHEGDRVRLVAAVGLAGKIKPMLDPAVMKGLGGKALMEFWCAWSDLNGDGKVQVDEVQFWPRGDDRTPMTFDPQLNAQIGRIGFRVARWLPDGTPVYEREDRPGLWTGMTMRLVNGNYYHFEDANSASLCAGISPEGKVLWTYKTEGSGVHALYKAKPRHAGQMLCNLGIVGHMTAQAGDLGEFLVFNTNVGLFNIMTADGLFAGQLFREVRDPAARPWSGKDNARGLRLDDTTPGQEHFNGHMTLTQDGQYLLVAGHNHASVVEVVGMDRFKRFGGSVEVGAEQIAATRRWELGQKKQEVYARAPVLDCFRMDSPPKLDGQLNDWGAVSAQIDDHAKFRIGYDDQNLYVAYEISRRGPLKNTGKQWDRLFKTGAAVDLHIGTDPSAAEDRRAPGVGDQRLLMTFMDQDPAMVLYRAVVPGTPAEKVWQVVSPVGSVGFDQVARLEKPRLVASSDKDRYIVEAAIPLNELGLKVRADLRLKMDWGVLVSGPDGNEVLRREYWANKSTQIIADAPSEAELHPSLWGHVRFQGQVLGSQTDPTSRKKGASVDDLLNELK